MEFLLISLKRIFYCYFHIYVIKIFNIIKSCNTFVINCINNISYEIRVDGLLFLFLFTVKLEFFSTVT